DPARIICTLVLSPELVPGVGFEPTSPRFRRGAVTRSASQAMIEEDARERVDARELVRTAGVEPTPPEWRSGTLPLSHVRMARLPKVSAGEGWCVPEDSNLSSADLPVS